MYEKYDDIFHVRLQISSYSIDMGIGNLIWLTVYKFEFENSTKPFGKPGL